MYDLSLFFAEGNSSFNAREPNNSYLFKYRISSVTTGVFYIVTVLLFMESISLAFEYAMTNPVKT